MRGERTENEDRYPLALYSSSLTLALSQRERGLSADGLSPAVVSVDALPDAWSGRCIAGWRSACLHVFLGVASVGLTWWLGRGWGLGNRGAAVAAMLVACDPILLNQSTQVMTETPATFLATAGLVLLTLASRRPTVGRMIATGIDFIFGALCRPTLLLWTILVGAILHPQ